MQCRMAAAYEMLRDYSRIEELEAEVSRNSTWKHGSEIASGSSADGNSTTDRSNGAAAADPPAEEPHGTGAAAGRSASKPRSQKAGTKKRKPKDADPNVT